MDFREVEFWKREAERRELLAEARRINELRVAQATQEGYEPHMLSLKYRIMNIETPPESESGPASEESEE